MSTSSILGENGTGKELVAHAIHDAGPRRDEAFVPINCGAIPENLLESELFGHERGAFTDGAPLARGQVRAGRIAAPCSSTRSAMCRVHLQVKLLRFLQDHVVQRVGGLESRTVDARVVAATNRDLKTMIADGRFREDLDYRLGVIVIQVPPLRERGDDLRLLAEYFLEFYGREHKRRIKGFTQAALRAIMAACMARQRARAREPHAARRHHVAGCLSAPEDLELESVGGSSDPLPTLQSARDEAERRLLVEALTRNAGNVTRAARDIEVSRPTLHDLLRKHGLEAARFRRGGRPNRTTTSPAAALDARHRGR
jgi:two-component system NtrC family response regulator